MFGSVKTGLYLPSSDLDVVVFGRWKTRPLFTLSDMLVSKGLCTQDDMRVIDKATVRSEYELSIFKLLSLHECYAACVFQKLLRSASASVSGASNKLGE